jgi:hypothetical protein
MDGARLHQRARALVEAHELDTVPFEPLSTSRLALLRTSPRSDEALDDEHGLGRAQVALLVVALLVQRHN